MLEAVINNASFTDSCLQLDRSLKTASNCSMSSSCLSSWRPARLLSSLQLDSSLKMASNCSMSSGYLSSGRPVIANSDTTITSSLVQILKLPPTATKTLVVFLGGCHVVVSNGVAAITYNCLTPDSKLEMQVIVATRFYLQRPGAAHALHSNKFCFSFSVQKKTAVSLNFYLNAQS